MAGVGDCGRRRRLGAGRPGTGVHGRIHRVYHDRHHHLSHDNHAVGGGDERADVAEGGFHEWRNVMSRESRLTAGVLLILMPTVVYGGASWRGSLRRTPRTGSAPAATGRHPSWRVLPPRRA